MCRVGQALAGLRGQGGQGLGTGRRQGAERGPLRNEKAAAWALRCDGGGSVSGVALVVGFLQRSPLSKADEAAGLADHQVVEDLDPEE